MVSNRFSQTHVQCLLEINQLVIKGSDTAPYQIDDAWMKEITPAYFQRFSSWQNDWKNEFVWIVE